MYQPYSTPFDHQLRVWETSRDAKFFGAFWEQGTGKTKLSIDTIGHLYTEGKIDAVIVVAPNGVHLNWVTDELPKHLDPTIDLDARAFKGESSSTKWHQASMKELLIHRGLSFLAISYDAWMTKNGKQLVWDLMRKRRVLLILDESHRVKTPSAKRTQSILKGGKHAAYRRILSGTPVTQGPFDLYSQMRFLDPDIWRREADIDTYTAFKAYFGVWDKGYNRAAEREYDILVGYQNLDELTAIIQKYTSRVRKDDVLDLPAKLYSKRYYEMVPEQARLYRELETEFMTFLEGDMVTADLAIVRALRLQQVLCGYLPTDGATEPTEFISRDYNPRLKLLRDTMEDVQGKSIIWATWTRDIDMIMETLKAEGRNPVRYDGRVSSDGRAQAKEAFKHGDATDFVANSQMSEGLTLNEAKVTIYYANSYKLIDRKQTEDRNHRIGQTEHVTYIDLCCPGTRDADVIQALIEKHEVASVILGDKVEKWLDQ